MLNAIETYLVQRRATGFAMSNAEYLLKSFAAFAAERGQTHVLTQTAIDWIDLGDLWIIRGSLAEGEESPVNDATPQPFFLVEEAPPGAVPFDRLKPDAYDFWCRRLISNPSPTSPAPNSGSELGSEVVGIGMRVTSVLDQLTK